MTPRDPTPEEVMPDPMKTDPHPPEKPPARDETPPAGPHHDEDLTDEIKTPGSGVLPDEDPAGGVEPGTG